MKKSICFVFLLLAGYSFSQEYTKFTDSRDDKTYKTITIKNQVWMAENLAFNWWNKKIMADSMWAYGDDETNVAKYGYLYTWEAAQNACPEGWRLPAKSDFETLLNNIGSSRQDAYKALIKGGSSGFSASFGGWRSDNGSFQMEGYFAYFWTETESSSEMAWQLDIDSFSSDVHLNGGMKSWGLSVRCIKKD